MIENMIVTNKEGNAKEIDNSNLAENDLQFTFVEKVTWKSNGKSYQLSNFLWYFPLFMQNKIVCIEHKDFMQSPHPNNLIVYNDDKSIYKTISVPPFINEQTIRESIRPKSEPGKFEVLELIKLIDGKQHLIVLISTETHHAKWGLCPLLEKRALDIETWQWHPTWSEGGLYWG